MGIKHNCFCAGVALATLLLALPLSNTFLSANADDTPLVNAARVLDTATVQALIADGMDINQTQPDGATALHWASYRDDAELAIILLAAGADVNAINDLGATPLWLAADNGSAPMVERLLERGANPNIALLVGETPLMTASRTGNTDAVRLLIEHGVSVNVTEQRREQTALMWAVAQGHNKTVALLLEHDADVTARSKTRPRLMYNDSTNGSQYDQGFVWNRGGYTALLFAARSGNVEAGRLLVEANADIDNAAPTGASPLVVAAHSGHTTFAQFALDEGADPNAIDAGYTPLHVAVLRGDRTLVSALLDAGAEPNTRYTSGTPVRRASRDWYLRPQLISATPYWLAAYYQEPEIMELLVEGGADATLTTLEQWGNVFERAGGVGPPHIVGGFQTALHAAVQGRYDRGRSNLSSLERDVDGEERQALDAATVAIEHGSNVNSTDHNGNSAMHTAAQRNYETVVRFLAEQGADLDLENDSGQTPLALAARAEERRIARPDITVYPSGNSAEALRNLGAVDSSKSDDTRASNNGQQ